MPEEVFKYLKEIGGEKRIKFFRYFP